MISKFVDLLVAYLKDRTWWPVVRPVFQIVTLYVLAGVVAYQYIEWRYQFTPELGTFLHSYLVKQVTIVFLASALLALVLGVPWRKSAHYEAAARIGAWARAGARNLVLVGIIVVIAMTLFLRLVPHGVSNIGIKFMQEPKSFNQYALTYIIYEVNRLQSGWHFTLDPDIFNPRTLTTAEARACDTDSLCYAKLIAHGQPLIGITESGFAQDSFWMNSGTVSVISAGQWQNYEPPSIYDYLSYSLIVQGILIHLNQACGGPPSEAFTPSRHSYGDLFEFVPRRNEMKAAILAAHLSPKGRELLANCFGLQYMNESDQLLSLDWLHSGRVHDNLEKTFDDVLGHKNKRRPK